jgi:hypothetical protein
MPNRDTLGPILSPDPKVAFLPSLRTSSDQAQRQLSPGPLGILSIWLRRFTGRRTIRELTSEQIRELDLDPVALRLEAAKPFWRA